MKILFDHSLPFFLAHGGFQTQIEQTKKALEEIGVEVEYLRWWDQTQTGDIIHFFGRPLAGYIHHAHQKGIKVIIAELHTGLGSRSAKARWVQKRLMQISQKIVPESFIAKLAWQSYQTADACIALTSWEASLMRDMFDAPPDKIHVVPNGVEAVFFERPATPIQKKDYLVCTATITERKRVLELAEAAVIAQTPVWIIGKPYTEDDPYYLRFLEIVKKSPQIVRYEGGINDRARLATIYREARGFVLLSTMESLSLSALEAAACGCPLLLSDLPWARSVFGENAIYCPITRAAATINTIKQFYEDARTPRSIFPVHGWREIAHSLHKIYLQ